MLRQAHHPTGERQYHAPCRVGAWRPIRTKVSVVRDITHDFATGSEFSLHEWCFGLLAGIWPDGIQFHKADRIYTLIGRQVIDEAGEIVDWSKWCHTGHSKWRVSIVEDQLEDNAKAK